MLIDVKEAARLTGRTVGALYRAASRGTCASATHGAPLDHGGLPRRLFDRDRVVAEAAELQAQRARRATVVQLLREYPELSNAEVGRLGGVSPKFVSEWRRRLKAPRQNSGGKP